MHGNRTRLEFPIFAANLSFAPVSSLFFAPVALLRGSKKPSSRYKIFNFRLTLTTQDEFIEIRVLFHKYFYICI